MKAKNTAPSEPTRDACDPETDTVSAVGALMKLVREDEPPRKVRLVSGRAVILDETEDDLVTVVGPEGDVELAVRFTAAGPVLTFSSAAIRMKTPGRIDLDCGKLGIRATHGIDLETGGDLTQNVDGHHTLRVNGRTLTEAYAVEVRSERGDVKVKANDNVRIDGEKILLNC